MRHEKIERYEKAHEHSRKHVDELLVSSLCGCFYCCRIYIPIEIKKWIDGGATAMCPYCGIDAVIGSVSGYPIEEEFLLEMKWYWFDSNAGTLVMGAT